VLDLEGTDEIAAADTAEAVVTGGPITMVPEATGTAISEREARVAPHVAPRRPAPPARPKSPPPASSSASNSGSASNEPDVGF
jgi:hypothetical protein